MLKDELLSAQPHDFGHKLTLPLTLIIVGKEYQWDYQFITGRQIKDLAGLSDQDELYLTVTEPWNDEPVGDSDRIDLAREGIEYFYIRQPLRFFANDKEYEWKHQYITSAELKRLVGAEKQYEVLLLLSRPYQDEVITDAARVDLARPGIEHFRIRKKGEDIKVSIKINDKEYYVKRGRHTVASLKQLGGVPPTDELNEVIAGRLTALADDATVEIKGCEEFFSCKRGGSSS